MDVAAQQSPSISVRDVVVAEGNSGTVQATFVVALSGPSSQSVSFSFATSNGTATAGLNRKFRIETTSSLQLEFTQAAKR